VFWLDDNVQLLRVVDGKPEDRPTYRAAGVVYRFGDTVIVTGLVGRIRHGEPVQFFRQLSREGVRYLLGERHGNHTIPGARRIEKGPFTGWLCVDLKQFSGIWHDDD